MPINSDKTPRWKTDIAQSIDFYNDWFLRYRTKEVFASSKKTSILETRQYVLLNNWLLRHGYKQTASDEYGSLDTMPSGSFSFCRTSSSGKKTTSTNIPTYCIVNPIDACKVRRPVIIEAKSSESISSSVRSAKKDAKKFATFKDHYKGNAEFMLLLCGHFDGYYLGPQAAEGIDWVWQHRLDDLGALLVDGKRQTQN